MKCSIMQPTYFPWLGYFDLIDSVDCFVFYDDVQMEKSSWQLRNRIKANQCELFISVCRKRNKGGDLCLIKDVPLNDQENWRVKHLKTLQTYYGKADHFRETYDFIKSLIENDIGCLGDLNINIISEIARKIGIKTRLLMSSREFSDLDGEKDVRLAKICKRLQCDTYISPQGSAIYLNRNSPGGYITASDINLLYHSYHHPVYKQLGNGFLPYMSILDLLFNVGFASALECIRKGHSNFLPMAEQPLEAEQGTSNHEDVYW